MQSSNAPAHRHLSIIKPSLCSNRPRADREVRCRPSRRIVARPLQAVALCVLAGLLLCMPAGRARSDAGPIHRPGLHEPSFMRFAPAGAFPTGRASDHDSLSRDVQLRRRTAAVITTGAVAASEKEKGVRIFKIILCGPGLTGHFISHDNCTA